MNRSAKYNFFDLPVCGLIKIVCAGVVELVDARDSKSRVPWGRVGSIPTAGTSNFNKIQ